MKKKITIRFWVQIFFFILIGSVAVSHGLDEMGIDIPLIQGVSLHSVCPFGGVVSIYNMITGAPLVKKVHESSVVLMYIVFLSAIFLGPLFCGWVCPFGTFQRWLAVLGRKILGKRYNKLSLGKLHNLLSFLRYLVLAWVVYMTAISGQLIFNDYDPYFALFQFWTGEVAIRGFIALGLVVIFSIFVERPFCKYVCPYGAVLGIFNLFRIIPLKRNKTTCIDCQRCDAVCPMGIRSSNKDLVRSHLCISCFECTSTEGVCPVEETLIFDTGFKKLGSGEALK